MDDNGTLKTTLNNKTYLLVWAALMALLSFTVIIAEASVSGAFTEAANLAIATVKASLVLFFFMNLGFERGFQRVAVTLSIVTLAALFWLVFSDVAYRK